MGALVGYRVAMRLHISLDDALVAELDRRVGPRDRSRFIDRAVRQSLDEARRRESLESAFGALAGSSHDWDDDPAGWVRRQRADGRAG